MFGVFSVVAAGYSWIPVTAFAGAIIHFGISSWLFLWLPRAGRITACISAVILCIWPAGAFVSTIRQELFSLLFFGIPLIFNGVVVYNHIITYRRPYVIGRRARIVMTVIPFALFLYYLVYLIRLFA